MTAHVRPVGPVDVLVVGFPDAKPDGSIAAAISELVANGTVRILDLVLVYKDDAGEVILAEVTDVDGDGIPDLVAMRGDLPGLLTDADARAAVEGPAWPCGGRERCCWAPNGSPRATSMPRSTSSRP